MKALKLKMKAQSSGPMRALSNETLGEVVRKICAAREAGKPYSEIYQEVKPLWPDGEGPTNAESLAKFMNTLAKSPRAPAGFKEWWAKRPGRFTGVKPISPNKPNPPSVTETLKDSSRVKEQLHELFSLSDRLVKLGAMDAAGALEMARKYIDKL